jgi:hypothetical protein
MLGVLKRSIRNAGCDSHAWGWFRFLLAVDARGRNEIENRTTMQEAARLNGQQPTFQRFGMDGITTGRG